MIRWIRDNKGRLVDPLVGVAALAIIATHSVGGFGPGFNNTASAVNSASVQLQEFKGATTCNTTGSGAGGTVSATDTNDTCSMRALVGTLDQVPEGTILATTLTVTNVGDLSATVVSMSTGACSGASASVSARYTGRASAGFCGEVDVSIADTTTGATDKCVFPTQAADCPALSDANTLASLSDVAFSAVPPLALGVGDSATYVVSVQIDASATKADQGLSASVPFTWSVRQ